MEQALQIVGEAVRASNTFDLEQLMRDLEQRSGVSLVERWQQLQPEQ
jgi:hypothetical protein